MMFVSQYFLKYLKKNNSRSTGRCKNSTERSCVHLHHSSNGNINCNIITVYNQRQKINIGTILKPYKDFSSFTCTYLRVCVLCKVLCGFITCVDLCNHHNNQDTEQFHPHKDPSFYTLTVTTANPVPNPWEPLNQFSVM